MNFDFDELSKLAKADPELFELRRTQLIQTEISKAPSHLQEKLASNAKEVRQPSFYYTLQRLSDHCMKAISTNLEDLEDQWNCIKAIAERK